MMRAQNEHAERRVYMTLLVILLAATALRVWGLDYGLPHTLARPDEERIVGRAHHIFATGNFHPGSFAYPSLLIYLDTLALGVYFYIAKLFGHYDRTWDFLFEAAVTRPGLHYVICRAVTVVAGVLTVGATYQLGFRAYGSRGVGLLAAMALAACHLHVRDSHFGTVDIAMTLFVTVSLLFAVKAAEDPSVRHFVLAGAFAGFASSTKYNAGLVIVSLVAAAWINFRREKDSVGGKSLAARALLGAVAMVAAFALTSPYAVLRYPAVLADLARVKETIYVPGLEIALWQHLKVTFPAGLGWPFFVAALVGWCRAAWLRRPADVVLLTFLVPFSLHIATVQVVYPRYVLPLIPLAAVSAAELILAGMARVAPAGRRERLLLFLAAIALVAPGLWSSIQFDLLAAKKDTRVLAAEWVARHLPPRSEILVCRGYGAPQINEDRRRPPAFLPQIIPCTKANVERASSNYLVTHEHSQLSSFSQVPASLSRWLDLNADLRVAFDPYRGRASDAFFYRSDAFYLPFSGFQSFERGGPLVRVWQLRKSVP
jgi:4-amino-4-deoxy-L-arabinose transferase-like glycosyltransferase